MSAEPADVGEGHVGRLGVAAARSSRWPQVDQEVLVADHQSSCGPGACGRPPAVSAVSTRAWPRPPRPAGPARRSAPGPASGRPGTTRCPPPGGHLADLLDPAGCSGWTARTARPPGPRPPPWRVRPSGWASRWNPVGRDAPAACAAAVPSRPVPGVHALTRRAAPAARASTCAPGLARSPAAVRSRPEPPGVVVVDLGGQQPPGLPFKLDAGVTLRDPARRPCTRHPDRWRTT